MTDPRSDKEREREQRLKALEDDIGRHLAESARNGELQRAPSFGKPLSFGDGYDETPAELRMAMKVLKDAGVVPPEVEMMQTIGALQSRLDALPDRDGAEAVALKREITEKRQVLALRLEQLRRNAVL
jgi:hypothetical protein